MILEQLDREAELIIAFNFLGEEFSDTTRPSTFHGLSCIIVIA